MGKALIRHPISTCAYSLDEELRCGVKDPLNIYKWSFNIHTIWIHGHGKSTNSTSHFDLCTSSSKKAKFIKILSNLIIYLKNTPNFREKVLIIPLNFQKSSKLTLRIVLEENR